jgi:uncharacterized protein (DUF2147 family)
MPDQGSERSSSWLGSAVRHDGAEKQRVSPIRPRPYVDEMKRILPALLLAALALPASAQRSTGPEGVWRNAKNSVRIRVARCGPGLCGHVVQASAQAQADAAQGGTARLVGTDLFRGLVREPDGLWYGQVYVPDLGRSVEGTLEQTGPNTLVAEGCLFAGFGCKAQTWTRVR